MPPLIPFGFGNRAPDVFGNVHTRMDEEGYTMLRHPGDYVGRHRQQEAETAPSWWWEKPLKFLAWLAGERV